MYTCYLFAITNIVSLHSVLFHMEISYAHTIFCISYLNQNDYSCSYINYVKLCLRYYFILRVTSHLVAGASVMTLEGNLNFVMIRNASGKVCRVVIVICFMLHSPVYVVYIVTEYTKLKHFAYSVTLKPRSDIFTAIYDFYPWIGMIIVYYA